MNTKSAKKVLEEYGLTILKWNGTFTVATVRTASGETESVQTSGGREKLLLRLEKFRTAPGTPAAN